MTNININQPELRVKITGISWAVLPAERPRSAGKNARLDVHGKNGSVRIARITAGGLEGFGWCAAPKEQAELLIGLSLNEMFNSGGMLKKEYLRFEFPILDLAGKLLQKPVYRLAAKAPDSLPEQFSAPVYDTSIYFDELHIEDDKEAVDFICSEVDYGLRQSHKNFKIKIGRCAMWMEHEAGMRRDIDIVRAIRKLTGPDAKLMVDANNGYNLSLTKRFLEETKEADIYWIEEPFHEDDAQFLNLRAWKKDKGITTYLADGEGYACPAIVNWAKKGIVDVLQYDLRDYGFFNWIALGEDLASYDVLCAPHNYGGFYGNFAQAHIAPAIERFCIGEYDAMTADGVDTSGYTIKDGRLYVPETAGFGLIFDSSVFESYTAQNGWKI